MFVRALYAAFLLAASLSFGLSASPAHAQLVGLSQSGDRLIVIGERNRRVRVLDEVRLKTASSGKIVAIDLRAADGEFYGFSEQGDLYRINAKTGALTKKFAFASVLPGPISMDCDAAQDACRLVSENGFNARFTFKDGVLFVDDSLVYSRGPAQPRVSAIAFADSFLGGGRGDLIAIDAAKDKVFLVEKPKTGAMSAIGEARPRVEGPVAFDIVSYGPGDNVAAMIYGRALYRYSFSDGVFSRLATVEGLDVDLRDVAFGFAVR